MTFTPTPEAVEVVANGQLKRKFGDIGAIVTDTDRNGAREDIAAFVEAEGLKIERDDSFAWGDDQQRLVGPWRKRD